MTLPYPDISAAAAARTPVNIGAAANDNTGDPLRQAFARMNARAAGLEAAVDQADANFDNLEGRTTLVEGSALFLNPRGDWVTGTPYVYTPGVRRDWFMKDGSPYLVAVSHTAGTFATDLSTGKVINADAAHNASELAAHAADIAALELAVPAIRNDLLSTAAGKGSQMVKHKYPGSALEITLATAFDREVWVEGYIEAAGDATTWFQHALDAMSARGGGIVRFSGNYLISGTLNIPANVSLIGVLSSPGQQVPGTLADYDAFGSVLRLGSTATIQLRPGAGLSRALLIRDNLNMPLTSATAAATAIAAFGGTAITLLGSDCRLEDLLVLGFNKLLASADHHRMRFINVQGDCTNGFDISNCLDTAYFENCHLWPYVSANQSWTADDTTQAILTRSGTAFNLHDTVDWPKLRSCFSYGYFRGFILSNIASAVLDCCSADGPVSGGATVHAGSIGFLFQGLLYDINLTTCMAAGKSEGYYNNATAGSHVGFAECSAVACTEGLLANGAGDVTWVNGLFRACAYAVQVSNATANVRVTRPRIRDYTAAGPVNVTVATAKLFLLEPDYVQPAAGASMVVGAANWTLPTVGAADPMHLPAHVGNQFLVTGTATIGTITGGFPGRRVTLHCVASMTFVNGSSIRLAGGVNFTPAAGGSLVLEWNGTKWVEVGRCA